jgi:hypothetical protein
LLLQWLISWKTEPDLLMFSFLQQSFDLLALLVGLKLILLHVRKNKLLVGFAVVQGAVWLLMEVILLKMM